MPRWSTRTVLLHVAYAGLARFLFATTADAAWTPPGIDLTRPRIPFRSGELPIIQSRLDRPPYRALLDELLLRIHLADATRLDDHTINAERIKARAAKNLAFLTVRRPRRSPSLRTPPACSTSPATAA